MKTKDNAKFNIVLVVGLVFKADKVLIGQRSWDEVQAPGKWSLPGGKVEVKGEFFSGALERTLKHEIQEEMGVVMQEEMDYLRSGSFIRTDGAHVVSTLFACRWRTGKAKALEDTINVKWIGKDELDKFDFATGVRDAIELGFKHLETAG